MSGSNGRTISHGVVLWKVVQIAGLHTHEIVCLGSRRISYVRQHDEDRILLTVAGLIFMVTGR